MRHKLLDVIGDLALIGHPIIGHIVAHRGGHALHASFSQKILEDSGAWKLVESILGPADEMKPAATTNVNDPVPAS